MAASGIGGALISSIAYSIHRHNTYSPCASLAPTVRQSPQRAPDDAPEKSSLQKKLSIKTGGVPKDGCLTLKDYFDQSAEFIRRSDGGPPRWFSPLECGVRLENSPLLLYLPGQLSFIYLLIVLLVLHFVK